MEERVSGLPCLCIGDPLKHKPTQIVCRFTNGHSVDTANKLSLFATDFGLRRRKRSLNLLLDINEHISIFSIDRQEEMDTPTSGPGSPAIEELETSRVLPPEILHFERQFNVANAGILTRRDWLEGKLEQIQSGATDEQSGESASSQKKQFLKDRRFMQSVLKEVNATEWMFAGGKF